MCSDTPTHVATFTSPRLALTNHPNKQSLLDFIDRAAKATTGKNAKRHIYVLTCYFNEDALVRVISKIVKRLNNVLEKVTGVTVAIDVGEWIKRRVTSEKLTKRISDAAKVLEERIEMFPVQVRGRLLHAKAYAAIKLPNQEKGFVVITSGNTTQRGSVALRSVVPF